MESTLVIDTQVYEFLQNLGFTIVFCLTFIIALLLVILFVKGYQSNGN